MEYASLVLLHVFFAIIWAGGAVAVGLFIIPSVMEAGPGGGAVMAGVMKRRFPVVMSVAGFLVILSGIRLFTLQPLGAVWFSTPQGIVLSLGALLGIAALGFGFLLQRPAAMRLSALGGEIAAAGKPPTAEQAAEMKALQARLIKVARLTAWHLIAAALLMSSHRLAAMM